MGHLNISDLLWKAAGGESMLRSDASFRTQLQIASSHRKEGREKKGEGRKEGRNEQTNKEKKERR